MDIFITTLLTTGLFTIIYLYLTRIFSYWTKLNIPYFKTGFLEPPGTKVSRAYNYFKSKGHKHGGVFFFFKPTYIPVDIELIERIAKSDFNYFANRGIFLDQPEILQNLLVMTDDAWKNMRAKLTPTFTSGNFFLI